MTAADDQFERFSLAPHGPAHDRLAVLKEHFPEIFEEGTIDWDEFQQLVGAWIEPAAESFGLHWPGKAQAHRTMQEPSLGALLPDLDRSVDWGTTRHVVIEGENLETLKLLQRSYHGEVKLVYIDPPYNTGNDFIYPDDFSEGLEDYLHFSGQIDEAGRIHTAKTETSGRHHSKWLSMMYPRIALARNLLRDDGVILISINDREVHHLRCILNEIFGEENFYAQFIWNNEGNVDNQSAVKGVHEYVLCYARNKDLLPRPGVVDPNVGDDSKLFNERIENTLTKNGPKNPVSVVELPIGFPAAFDEGVLEPRDDKWPHILDEVRVAGGKLSQPCRLSSGWSSRSMLDLYLSNGFVPIEDAEGKLTSFALTPSGAIYSYKERSERQGHVLSILRNMGTTQQMSRQLADWGIEFPYPKPSFLIQYLISIFTDTDSADLVMDFFAGSGSTAHAVMQQNQADGGNRRYLLVQLPQSIAGTDDTVADLLHRRIVATAQSLGPEQGQAQDRGFRSYRLGSSNFRVWNGREPGDGELVEELTLFASGLTPEATTAGIVAELMLKAGFELTEACVERDASGLVVHVAADGQLVVVPDGRVTLDSIDAIIEMEPSLVLVLDSCFADDDELKVNTMQTIRAANQGAGSSISLKVV